MTALLERGTEIRPNVRIRRRLAGGEQWELYDTNVETKVLAVTAELYGEWSKRDAFPESIFLPEERFPHCRVFAASENYMVSSLLQGPYPTDTAQIDAFAVAFQKAMEDGTMARAGDAIYLEEYSLLLPVGEGENRRDILFGHWISGGMDLGCEDFQRMSRLMAWMPYERLKHCYILAGFEPSALTESVDDEKTLIIRRGRGQEEKKTPVAGKVPVTKGGEPFSLPGRPALEQFFRENIIDVVLHREAYERMGIHFPGATVLYGPPGSGKTYAVERLAEYLGWPRFDIDSGSVGSSYIHETSRRISEIFTKAMEQAPSILVIDEMEAFLSERRGGSPASTHHMEEVAEFLRKIPEAVEQGVLIFAMTNMLDSIDPAILRRGRFDHMLKVDFATKEEMQAFLEKRFSELPVDETVDTEALAAELAGHPLSDAAFVLKEAGRFAVRCGLERISATCLDNALTQLPHKKETRKIGF